MIAIRAGSLPAGCARLAPRDLRRLLPALDPDAHKGERGALGVWAGSRSGMGAARIAARAGSASGAGTVTLLVRDELWPVAATSLDAQIVRALSDGPGRRLDAALAGPGWGVDDISRGELERLWDGPLPLVLDADALRMLGDRPSRPSGAPLVLTPHPGEFAALAAAAKLEIDSYAFASARRAAERFGAVVVLKGSVTVLADPAGRLAAWVGREPTLGTGGSGDALAGLLAGLLARGAAPWDAARAAVIAHGLAGRRAARSLGFYEAGALIPEMARLACRWRYHGNRR